jgi:hypothetical protein
MQYGNPGGPGESDDLFFAWVPLGEKVLRSTFILQRNHTGFTCTLGFAVSSPMGFPNNRFT